MGRLLDRFNRESETESFASIYREYAPRMRHFVGRLLQDNVLTDDVVHNVFLRLWENREIITKVESLDRYLFRAARNAIFDIYDHRTIIAKYEQKSRSKDAEVFNLEEQINAEDLAMLIELAVDKMPPQRQKIFRMSRYSGYSNSEIAEQLSLSVNTVNNHLALALRELKQGLFVQ